MSATYPVNGILGPEAETIRAKCGDVIRNTKEFRGETFIAVQTESIVQVIQALKDDPELAYDYFVECLGVDYLTWTHPRDLPERFEVVYNLYSTKNHTRVFIKIGVNDGQPVSTVKDIFLGAEYPEREIQDLYGIPFAGNAEINGMRFLLPDDWVGHPLRKDVPLGGEDVRFHLGTTGPAVEDLQVPHAGESFEGKTGSSDTSIR